MSYTLRDFRQFAPLLRIENGDPLKLEPFQVAMLRDHFGPARELVAILPKKNGKTTLLASLALFHIAEVRDAECLIAASSRDQAGIMFRQAVSMLKRSAIVDANDKKLYRIGGHEYRILDGYREIRCNGGRVKVMAADEDTGDGIIPTLGLIDELHRAKNGALYGVFSDGLGPRNGRLVTISTAGYTSDSPLGLLRKRAHEVGGVKKGRHLRVVDGAFILHEWALDPTDDPENLRHVKKANPSSMQSLEELARRRNSLSHTTGRWLRFACGIWTAGEEPAILAAEWDMLRADIGRIEDGEEVILAPSVGGNAAIAVAAPRDDERVAVKVFHIPSTPERHIAAQAEDLIEDLCRRYDVATVLCPLGNFSYSGTRLEERGVPVEAAHPSPGRLAVATGTFDQLLRERKLIHEGDERTRTQVLNATKKVTEQGERYLPSDESRAIGAIAIAAHHVVANYAPEPLIVVPRAVG